MEVRHLRYFVAVAEELHFSRAAERLNITPPSLSHGIAALETMLGARLFVRRTKSAVALTQAGKRFFEEACNALRHFEHAELAGRQAARGEIGTIEVGYMHAASCSAFVPQSISAFCNSSPGVNFQLHQMDTFNQMKALLEGSIDVAFIRKPQRYPSGLGGFLISRHPFWAAVPKNHPLAAQSRISRSSLDNEKFIALTLEKEAGFWGNLTAVTSPGSSPQVVHRAPDSFSVLTLVGAGLGISIVSEPLRRIDIPGVVYRRIVGASRQSEFAVSYRNNESGTAVKAYIDLLRTMRER
jgi:DNA-binding transcriptional LysR family regulator